LGGRKKVAGVTCYVECSQDAQRKLEKGILSPERETLAGEGGVIAARVKRLSSEKCPKDSGERGELS